MLTVDVTMPFALFLVTLAALLLSKRVEGKLQSTFEEREFHARYVVLLVVMIGVAVSIIAFVPQIALIALFMFSYSSLLFTFSYFFSGLNKKRALLFISGFLVASLVVGLIALLGPFVGVSVFYGGLAAFGLAVFALGSSLLELRKGKLGGKWYLAVLPPALFVIAFFVFRSTPLWFPFLFDAFGVVFAILITLYLSSLFTWKTTFIFAGFLTVMDFILVLITQVTEPAAAQLTGLGLPVIIVLPIIPPIFNSAALWGLQQIGLGLGDFFFAGILATQTCKKFGMRTSIISAVTMSVAFGVFEILLLNTDFKAFPGTLMIILGWLPIVAWKLLVERKNKSKVIVGEKV